MKTDYRDKIIWVWVNKPYVWVLAAVLILLLAFKNKL